MPVALESEATAFPHGELRGRELADGGVQRAGRRDEAEGEERVERGGVPRLGDAGQRRQRTQGRARGEPMAVGGEVERHEPEVVAREQQPATLGVPQRQGERAAERLHAFEATLLVEVRDDLGVVASAERMPAAERDGELAAVVQPAGEDRAHRLILGGADRRARLTMRRHVRQQQRAPREIRASPPALRRLVIGPTGEHEHRVHAQPEPTSSTSSCTTAIVYSRSAVRSLARSWNAS